MWPGGVSWTEAADGMLFHRTDSGSDAPVNLLVDVLIVPQQTDSLLGWFEQVRELFLSYQVRELQEGEIPFDLGGGETSLVHYPRLCGPVPGDE